MCSSALSNTRNLSRLSAAKLGHNRALKLQLSSIDRAEVNGGNQKTIDRLCHFRIFVIIRCESTLQEVHTQCRNQKLGTIVHTGEGEGERTTTNQYLPHVNLIFFPLGREENFELPKNHFKRGERDDRRRCGTHQVSSISSIKSRHSFVSRDFLDTVKHTMVS